MTIHIEEIKCPGDLERERVVLIARDDTATDDYVLLRARADHRGVYGGPGEMFWLWNRNVKKGDRIVIYTKKGETKQKITKDGVSSYFFYWGKDTPLWADAVFGAVLTLTLNRFKYRVGGFDEDVDVEPANAPT